MLNNELELCGIKAHDMDGVVRCVLFPIFLVALLGGGGVLYYMYHATAYAFQRSARYC